MKTLALGFALLAATLTARAQEFPRWEAFGGFSYANVNLGPQASLFNPSNRNYEVFDLERPDRHKLCPVQVQTAAET